MPNYIICPNCGKKINNDDLKTIYKLFYAYKVCNECGSKFTKIHARTNVFVALYYIIIYFICIIYLILIGLYYYDKILNESTSIIIFIYLLVILTVLGIVSNIVNHILCKKSLEKSNNGFLPIIENKNGKNKIQFLNEKYFKEKSNDCLPTKKAIVLLPSSNFSVTVLVDKKVELAKLHMYNVYKLIHKNFMEYVLLADYKIDGENIILHIKRFEECRVLSSINEKYSLLTIDDDLICYAITYST